MHEGHCYFGGMVSMHQLDLYYNTSTGFGQIPQPPAYYAPPSTGYMGSSWGMNYNGVAPPHRPSSANMTTRSHHATAGEGRLGGVHHRYHTQPNPAANTTRGAYPYPSGSSDHCSLSVHPVKRAVVSSSASVTSMSTNATLPTASHSSIANPRPTHSNKSFLPTVNKSLSSSSSAYSGSSSCYSSVSTCPSLTAATMTSHSGHSHSGNNNNNQNQGNGHNHSSQASNLAPAPSSTKKEQDVWEDDPGCVCHPGGQHSRMFPTRSDCLKSSPGPILLFAEGLARGSPDYSHFSPKNKDNNSCLSFSTEAGSVLSSHSSNSVDRLVSCESTRSPDCTPTARSPGETRLITGPVDTDPIIVDDNEQDLHVKEDENHCTSTNTSTYTTGVKTRRAHQFDEYCDKNQHKKMRSDEQVTGQEGDLNLSRGGACSKRSSKFYDRLYLHTLSPAALEVASFPAKKTAKKTVKS